MGKARGERRQVLLFTQQAGWSNIVRNEDGPAGPADEMMYALRTSLFLSIAFFATISVFPQQTRELKQERAGNTKRTALVLGNANYTVATKLSNPVNDAEDLAKALRALRFEVITGTDLTLREMRAKVREFGDALQTRGGTGLFYYAGHGVQVNGNNYLIPVDGDIPREDEIDDLALNLDVVFGKMATAKNDFNIVILDACRNNPFATSWKRGGDLGGLAQVNAPSGSFIGYATDVNRTADDGKGRNGTYTGELLQLINTPYLNLENLFKDVAKRVRVATSGRQTPWTSSSFSGDFFFVDQMDNAAMYKRWSQMLKARRYTEILDETAIELRRDPSSLIGLRMYANAVQPAPPGYSPITTPRKTAGVSTPGYMYSSSLIRERVKRAPDIKDAYETEAYCFFYAQFLSTESTKGLDYCNAATKLDPTLDLAFRSRATINYRLKKVDEAIGDYSSAISLDPTFADYLVERAAYLHQTKKLDEAIADLTRAIDLAPTGSEPYFARGYIYRWSGKFDLAIADLDQAVRLASPESLPHSLRARASAHRGAGHDDLALRDLTKLIELDRNDYRAYIDRGDHFLETKRPVEAIADFSEAIRVKEEALQRVRFSHIEIEQAAQAYERRYVAYNAAGKTELAERDRLKSLELNAEAKSARARTAALGVMMAGAEMKKEGTGGARTDAGRNEGRIADLTKLIEINPTYSGNYYDRGILYASEKKYDLAIVDFTETIKRNYEQLELAKSKNDTQLELLVLRYLENVFQRRSAVYKTLGQTDLAEADAQKAQDYAAERKRKSGKEE